ncbi:MAG TPA: hypothetical protein DEF45_23370 [Rhodopirellula sp.]|nr:hypothetical protein [Rhodopirellula sp.]
MEFQDLVAFVIVLLAAAWLTRRIYRVLHSASGSDQIGACDHCPNNRDSAQPAQIVEINQKQVDESL